MERHRQNDEPPSAWEWVMRVSILLMLGFILWSALVCAGILPTGDVTEPPLPLINGF